MLKLYTSYIIALLTLCCPDTVDILTSYILNPKTPKITVIIKGVCTSQQIVL